MEILDVYNKDRIKTGKTMIRGSASQNGAYHLVVHACIFNSDGEMLIQQRQSFKRGWPNLWDVSVGGCVTTGETSQTAVQRELFEELGLNIDLKNMRPHMTINFSTGFDDIYLIEQDIDISSLTLQYEEVQQVKWASMEDIFQMLEEETFIPYHKSLIQLFFDMRRQYGCFYK